MVPLTARVAPVPKALPPEASAALSAVARITASSSAVTLTLALLAVTLRTYDSTSLRTSFLTTRPPSAIAFDALMLLPCGMIWVSLTCFQKRRSV